jgi:hypothetical protein
MANRKLTRTLQAGALLMAVALTVQVVRLVVPKVRAHAQSGGVSAYTVVLRESIVGADGVAHQGSLNTRALRSDGSSMTALGTISPGQKGSRIIELASGVRIQTDEWQQRKSTMVKPFDLTSRMQDPKSNCTAMLSGAPLSSRPVSLAGTENVGEFRAAKIVIDSTSTNWFALDYGCAPIKTYMNFGSQGSSGYSLVSFKPGEPDSALFSVAANYVEGPPSSLMRPTSSACGPDCQHSREAMAKAKDAEYWAHQPK